MPGDRARSLLTLKSAYSKVVLGPVQLPTGHHRKNESLGSGQNRHGVGPQAIFEASFGALEVLQARHVFSYLRSCLRSNLSFLTLRSSPTKRVNVLREGYRSKESALPGLGCPQAAIPPRLMAWILHIEKSRGAASLWAFPPLALAAAVPPAAAILFGQERRPPTGRPESHWGQCVSDYPW